MTDHAAGVSSLDDDQASGASSDPGGRARSAEALGSAQPDSGVSLCHAIEGAGARMTISDFTRWLYRGQRPNWLARILNRASAAVASAGVAPNYLVTLEVRGRRSGRTASLPVVIAVVDGQRYLVSMLGDNVQWVRNVRASGGRAVLRSGTREAIQLEEVPAGQRAPILKAYLQQAPGARPHVPVSKDAALAEFQEVAAAFPVFRVASDRPLPPPRPGGPRG
jgi:F420H(2)-dependent quinone reductase